VNEWRIPVGQDIRIDKWLWAVRIFKTRSQATEACRKGKILINDNPVKPSHAVRINEIIRVKHPPAVFSYLVKGLLGKRLSAKEVVHYVENITPREELDKLFQADTFFIKRDKGTGRPTKRDRRTIDKLRGW
jgi:ribosome-associated heat shock protein Hsp15